MIWICARIIKLGTYTQGTRDHQALGEADERVTTRVGRRHLFARRDDLNLITVKVKWSFV
jgi:hypothetical protein